MKRTTIFIFIFATAYQLFSGYSAPQTVFSYDRKEIKEQINELKATEYGRQFLLTYSSDDLEKVILFLCDPVRYFDDVRRIREVRRYDIERYMVIYERYLNETKRFEGFVLYPLLDGHLQKMDDKKVSILTFLLLKCSQGAYGEILAPRYISQFESNPDIFIKDLRERNDWKEVINELRGEDCTKFKATVAKLGNSEFEKQLKNYVSSLIPENNNRILD